MFGRRQENPPLDQPLLFTVAFVILCHAFYNNIFNIVGITQARRVCNVLWSAAGRPGFPLAGSLVAGAFGFGFTPRFP